MKWKKEKKNVIMPDYNTNSCEILRKDTDNDPEITQKVRSVKININL